MTFLYKSTSNFAIKRLENLVSDSAFLYSGIRQLTTTVF